MFTKKTIRRMPPDLRALAKIANGLDLESRRLTRHVRREFAEHRARQVAIKEFAARPLLTRPQVSDSDVDEFWQTLARDEGDD